MFQFEIFRVRVLGVVAIAISGAVGCTHSPHSQSRSNQDRPYQVLPSFKISKLPKRASFPQTSLGERLVVATSQPTIGQRVSFETTITNQDTRPVGVTENYLGTSRTHVLNPGEVLSVVYKYNRQLQSQVIAEYHVRPAGSDTVAKISLSENENGFGCVSSGTWCKFMPLAGKGLPDFRFSIPLGTQTFVGSNEPR